jgi:hypothetical protein
MFKFAESGIITHPTQFPVDVDGNPVDTTVLVRYRVLTRRELREIDGDNAAREEKRLAEVLADLMTPATGTDDIARAEAQRIKAEKTLAVLHEARAKVDEREQDRTARLLARVVSIQPPGESEFREFAPGELARLLEFEPLTKSFDRGLFAASRGAAAKN